MNLLQNLVDVDSVGLLAFPLCFPLGAIFVDLGSRPSSLLDGLAGNFGSHVGRQGRRESVMRRRGEIQLSMASGSLILNFEVESRMIFLKMSADSF